MNDFASMESEALMKGQGRVNQLGGVFINGRPLPQFLRVKIIQMANSGIKPCVISRDLRVSHGCVSKILQRFQKTGCVTPGVIGGSKPRVSTPKVLEAIAKYRKDSKTVYGWEIRERLVKDAVCTSTNVPSISSITRLIKQFEEQDSNKRLNSSGLDLNSDDSDHENPKEDDNSLQQRRRPRTCFTKAQIELMESVFLKTHYPDALQRQEISKQTSLCEARIQVWFSNRRARWRKQQHVRMPYPPQMMSNNLNFSQVSEQMLSPKDSVFKNDDIIKPTPKSPSDFEAFPKKWLPFESQNTPFQPFVSQAQTAALPMQTQVSPIHTVPDVTSSTAQQNPMGLYNCLSYAGAGQTPNFPSTYPHQFLPYQPNYQFPQLPTNLLSNCQASRLFQHYENQLYPNSCNVNAQNTLYNSYHQKMHCFTEPNTDTLTL